MESVELDANSAKQIVEIKLQKNDVKGAIFFARRLQNLFPKLRRLFQFLGNIVVYVSSEDEEIDWYTVLGVNPCADSKTMKQHYVELARNGLDSYEAHKILDEAWGILSNKFEGGSYDLRRRSRAMQQNALIVRQTTSANENVSQAFSNVNKTISSYQKRSSTICKTGARDQRSGFANNRETSVRNWEICGNPEVEFARHQPLNTFLTACHNCHFIYQSHRDCLNKKVDCLQCGKTFAALEVPGPQLISPYPNSQTYAPQPSNIFWSDKMNSQPGMHNVSGECESGVKIVPSAAIEVPSRPQVIGPYPNFDASYAPRPSITFRSDKMNIQPDTYNVSGECGSGQTLVSSSAIVPNPKVITPCPNSQASYAPRLSNTFWSDKMNIQPGVHNVSGEYGSGQTVVFSAKELITPSRVNSKRGYEGGDQTSAARGKAPCIYSTESGIGLPSVARTVGNKGVEHKKNMSLVDNIHAKSKNEPQNDMTAASGADGQIGVCQRHLGNYQGERTSVSWSSKGNSRENIVDILSEKLSDSEITSLLVRKTRNGIIKKLNEWNAAERDMNAYNATHNIENPTTEESGEDGLVTMEVPDSDFHDFDKERLQTSFGENQVWAAYDDDDGMPRLYALIRAVSRRPFKLQISWLNSKSSKELGPMNWIDSGFHKTCGDFWVGKKQISNKLNSFSHRVMGWTKSARVYQIFPKKGDVWALYRNWSPNWNEHTTKEEKHRYDIVEVLESYNEDKGVTIVPLLKVAGFKSVFYRHLNATKVRTIPKEEIFRFSHQVSSYLLTDQEAPNVPRGSKELDPAAMPLELLQVINYEHADVSLSMIIDQIL